MSTEIEVTRDRVLVKTNTKSKRHIRKLLEDASDIIREFASLDEKSVFG